jgi:hypothetical protein
LSQIYNVTYQSIQDKPPKGVNNSFWFGCSAAESNYWLHSYCFGIHPSRSEFQKDWEKVKWLCPDHQKPPTGINPIIINKINKILIYI